MTTKDEDSGIRQIVQQSTGLNEIVHALVLVGDTLRSEEDELSIEGESESTTGLLTIARLIDMCVDGIGDAGDLLSLEQRTGLCLGLEPTTAGDKIDALAIEHTLFLSPDAGREIVSRASTREQTTLMTGCGKMATAQGDMTNGRSRPDVVHRPDNGFA